MILVRFALQSFNVFSNGAKLTLSLCKSSLADLAARTGGLPPARQDRLGGPAANDGGRSRSYEGVLAGEAHDSFKRHNESNMPGPSAKIQRTVDRHEDIVRGDGPSQAGTYNLTQSNGTYARRKFSWTSRRSANYVHHKVVDSVFALKTLVSRNLKPIWIEDICSKIQARLHSY
jgi:hypothetical protein